MEEQEKKLLTLEQLEFIKQYIDLENAKDRESIPDSLPANGGNADTANALNIGIPAQGAGYHNSVYRGKYLGEAVTEAQWAAIQNGTFDDLYIGDYWTIGGINYRIAAFDYYFGTGQTTFCKKHHVTIVPDTAMYDAVFESSATATTAYASSELYNSGLNQAKNTVNQAFGESHILSHTLYLKNASTDGYESGGAWFDSTLEIMNEINVFGARVWSRGVNGTNMADNYEVDNSQFPLFALRKDMIALCPFFWLRDLATTLTVSVTHYGLSARSLARNANGVRPAFSIC